MNRSEDRGGFSGFAGALLGCIAGGVAGWWVGVAFVEPIRGTGLVAEQNFYWQMALKGSLAAVGALVGVFLGATAASKSRSSRSNENARQPGAANSGATKYLQIGGDLRIDGDQYWGPVIASAEAIYFVPQRKAKLLDGGGGLLGTLFERALDKSLSKSRLSTCDVAELPAETLADPTWPVKAKQGQVWIVPRDAVESVGLQAWHNSMLTFAVGENSFQVVVDLPRRNAVRRFLAEHGWNVRGPASDSGQSSMPFNKALVAVAALAAAIGMYVVGVFDGPRKLNRSMELNQIELQISIARHDRSEGNLTTLLASLREIDRDDVNPDDRVRARKLAAMAEGELAEVMKSKAKARSDDEAKERERRRYEIESKDAASLAHAAAQLVQTGDLDGARRMVDASAGEFEPKVGVERLQHVLNRLAVDDYSPGLLTEKHGSLELNQSIDSLFGARRDERKARYRALAQHVKPLVDGAKVMPIAQDFPRIKGKALIWDYSCDGWADDHHKLPDALRASPDDRAFTFVALRGPGKQLWEGRHLTFRDHSADLGREMVVVEWPSFEVYGPATYHGKDLAAWIANMAGK